MKKKTFKKALENLIMESKGLYKLIIYSGIHFELREEVAESKAEFTK